jgi:hypothetical protein
MPTTIAEHTAPTASAIVRDWLSFGMKLVVVPEANKSCRPPTAEHTQQL